MFIISFRNYALIIIDTEVTILNGIIERITSPELIFILPAIIVAITVHEFSHAIVSYKLGDPTPKIQRRLTLNPIDHIDPIGLISLILFGFGWGRPVQIDPRHYKNPSRDKLLVSLAGPASNFFMLIVFSVVLRFGSAIPFQWFWKIGIYMVQINAVLCVFNLLPLPPLDGSKILLEILPIKNKYTIYHTLQRYTMPIFLILVFTNLIDIVLNPMINALMSIASRIII